MAKKGGEKEGDSGDFVAIIDWSTWSPCAEHGCHHWSHAGVIHAENNGLAFPLPQSEFTSNQRLATCETAKMKCANSKYNLRCSPGCRESTAYDADIVIDWWSTHLKIVVCNGFYLLFDIYTVDFKGGTMAALSGSISNNNCLFSFIQHATIKVSLHHPDHLHWSIDGGINTTSFFPSRSKEEKFYSHVHDTELIKKLWRASHTTCTWTSTAHVGQSPIPAAS